MLLFWLHICRVVTDDRRSLYRYFQIVNVCAISHSAEITVGYTLSDVTVLETDGVARLTVAITMPSEADLIDTSFFLLVNTLDGTATGVQWSLECGYAPQSNIII